MERYLVMTKTPRSRVRSLPGTIFLVTIVLIQLFASFMLFVLVFSRIRSSYSFANSLIRRVLFSIAKNQIAFANTPTLVFLLLGLIHFMGGSLALKCTLRNVSPKTCRATGVYLFLWMIFCSLTIPMGPLLAFILVLTTMPAISLILGLKCKWLIAWRPISLRKDHREAVKSYLPFYSWDANHPSNPHLDTSQRQ